MRCARRDWYWETNETVELTLIAPEVSVQGDGTLGIPSVPPYITGSPYRATVRVTDVSTNAAMEVTLVQPTNGAVFFAPAAVMMQARSNVAEGWVASTAFYAGGNFLGAVTNIYMPPMPRTNTHS